MQCLTAVIRPAQAADLPVLLAAIASAGLNPIDIQAERFVMAEDSASGSFLGCGQLAPMRHESGLKLRSLLVEPANRGTGVGRELLQHLVIQGSSHVIYLIALDAGEQFYGREGFVEIPEAAIPSELHEEVLVGQEAGIRLSQRCLVMRRTADK